MTAGISRSIRLVATPENGSWSELRAPSHEFRTASRSETSSARIVPELDAADPSPASDLVLEQQDAVVGVLVVAAVADEVEDVVVASAKLALEGRRLASSSQSIGDRARLDERRERRLELRALLLRVDRFGVARAADDRRGSGSGARPGAAGAASAGPGSARSASTSRSTGSSDGRTCTPRGPAGAPGRPSARA